MIIFSSYFIEFYTTYNATVAAKTGGGYGPKTVAMVITREGAPSSPPTMVELTTVTAYKINMTWEPPPNDALNGILRNFIIEWRTSGGSNNSSIRLNSDEHSYMLTNLKPFTKYEVRIAAITSARGPFSNWSAVRTAEAGKNYIEPSQ